MRAQAQHLPGVGVAHYWLADPAEPSITILELVDGRYEQAQFARNNEVLTVSKPLTVDMTPGEVGAGLIGTRHRGPEQMIGHFASMAM